MPQGKLKVKTKLPTNIKNKKGTTKGPAVSKRANKPIQPKKKKFEETHKIKKMISKTVNEAMEEEMRSRAGSGKKTFSKVEQAIATYNSAQSTSTS